MDSDYQSGSSSSSGASVVAAGVNVAVSTSTAGSTTTYTVSAANAGLIGAIKTVTVSYTVTTADEIILVNAGSAAVTITLLSTTVASAGRKNIIIKTDTSNNAVTVSAQGSDLIQGAASVSLAAQYAKVGLITDGNGNYYDLGNGGV